MLWNVYVIEDGECSQFNNSPYSSDMVAMALEELGSVQSVQSVTLIPCSDQAKALEELEASLESTTAAERDSAETEGQP